jgi:tetratricopeptide (TPR) repeat protein
MARAMVGGYLGRAYTLSNRADDAIAVLKKAVDDAAGMDLMVDQALRLAHLAEAFLRAGRVDEAARMAHRALESAINYNERGAHAWTEWILGEIHSHLAGPEPAETHYRKCIELATLLEMRPLLAHCHLALGNDYRRARKDKRARQHLATAVDLYRALEMPFWLGQAEALLA